MSQKANPASIGLFFVIGLALAIAALAIFSSRGLFHPQRKAILYFNASLKGLNPGAPVKFRGVTIGTVSEILIRHNQAIDDFSMPVIISLDKKLAQTKSDEELPIGDRAGMDRLIHRNLRAQLDSESLVTGVLYVGLDMVPNAPPADFHQLKPEFDEIPTVPSEVQKLLDDLAHFDARGISEKLSTLLTHLDGTIKQLDVTGINAGVTNLLASANRVVASPDLTNSFSAFRHTLEQANAVLARIDGHVDPLADSVTNTLYDAQKTLADLRVAIRNVANLVGPDSAVPSDLEQTLEELSSASRAIAQLAELLQRNPNALLLGVRKEQP
jgi:paraquat-inducible protein B